VSKSKRIGVGIGIGIGIEALTAFSPGQATLLRSSSYGGRGYGCEVGILRSSQSEGG
jgi:hypothetical protein